MCEYKEGLCVYVQEFSKIYFGKVFLSTQTVAFWYLQKVTGLLAVQILWMLIPDTGRPWR